MYLCVMLARYLCVSQESERSCICVLWVSSQESERSCICMLGGIEPGKRAVMYLCVRSRGIKPGKWSCICVLWVSSQESERSCICVRGIARKASGHVFVC